MIVKFTVTVKAGQMSPRILGVYLSSLGIKTNIGLLCQKINAHENMKKFVGLEIPVKFKSIKGKIEFFVSTPTMVSFFKKFSNVKKCCRKKGQIIGKLSQQNVVDIAQIKFVSLNSLSLEKAIEHVKKEAIKMGFSIDE